MARIIRKENYAPECFLMEVEAAEIARKAEAGQFIVLKVDEQGERIPLSLGDIDPAKGILTLVFQVLGRTTSKLSRLHAGDDIMDFTGPLGKATEIKKYGKVVCVGGGIGLAPLYPLAKALKKAGNRVTVIAGARNKQFLVFENELLSASNELHITTDDGSKGRRGFVTQTLQDLLEKNKYDMVFVIGPPVMMKAVAGLTFLFKTPTIASLNPVMVDGTGMCGSCRVCVGGKTRFGCVDGPDFDAHEVDWELFMKRHEIYKKEEQISRELA